MGIYKTYLEAVLANGSTNNICKNKITGEFCRIDDVLTGMWADWKRCNPADHLETLESFLASGKRFIDGDSYIEKVGSVASVVSDDADNIYYGFATPQSDANFPMEGDDERFVLQAAADQVETHEEKEAFDSIPNQTTIDAMNSEAEKESYNSTSEAFGAIDTTAQQFESLAKDEWENGDTFIYKIDDTKLIYIGDHPLNSDLAYCAEGDAMSARVYPKDLLLKPENPEQREERESMERKAEIERMLSTSIKFNNTDLPKTIARIIDETGYRKQ